MKLVIGQSKIVVDPERGGAINELIINGKSILKTVDENAYEGSFLFPFPNRLNEGCFEFQGQQFQFPLNDGDRPNALHGLVADLPFQAEIIGQNSISVSLNYLGDRKYYPFPFRLKTTYTLKNDRLDLTTVIENTGEKLMPCGFGWHPYFQVEDVNECYLTLPRCEQLIVDENLIPTGEKVEEIRFIGKSTLRDEELDNCYLFPSREKEHIITLTYTNGSSLDIWQDANFPYAQIFTPDDRKRVAIEPVTCAINALNNHEHLRILKPNESWELNYGITLRA